MQRTPKPSSGFSSRSAPASNTNHHQPVQRINWLERLSFLGSWLLIGVALVICGMGATAVAHRLKHAPVAQVRVVGDLTPFEQRFLHKRLQGLNKQGYFQANLTTLRDAALAVSWVDQVRVTRHWPNGIIVRVTPKHAVARWGGVRLLSHDGSVFSESELRDHSDLVIMHGPQTQSLALMHLYQNVNKWFSPLGLHVKEIYFTDRLTCFMQFDNGLRIIVDQDRTLEKLQQLGLLAMGELRPAIKGLASIDLRYRNGFAVQWRDGQRPKVAAGQLLYTAP